MSDRFPTFADVCSAIAEGHIEAAVDGSMYQVNAFELRRYLNKHRPLPTIQYTSSSSPIQDPLPCSDVADWTSTAVQHSLAQAVEGRFFISSALSRSGCIEGKQGL